MLKVRLMGRKNSIRQFSRPLQKMPEYVEIERKEN